VNGANKIGLPNQRGLFVVLYGANNLRKTTQVNLLSSYLEQVLEGECLVIKYPRYETRFGQIINEVLRGDGASKWDIDDATLQWLFSEDRRAFQNDLVNLLENGVSVIAEDYVGTGIAWGLTKGLSMEYLLTCNQGLLEPDVSYCLMERGLVVVLRRAIDMSPQVPRFGRQIG
jgi:thymidylate kinase